MKTSKKKKLKEICSLCVKDDMWNETFYVISCNSCCRSYHLKCIIQNQTHFEELIAYYNEDNSSRSNIRFYCGFTAACKSKSLTIRYGRSKKAYEVDFNIDGKPYIN
jgi:hypothetical protein